MISFNIKKSSNQEVLLVYCRSRVAAFDHFVGITEKYHFHTKNAENSFFFGIRQLLGLLRDLI